MAINKKKLQPADAAHKDQTERKVAHPAKPVEEPVDYSAMIDRFMKRYPKIRARLGE